MERGDLFLNIILLSGGSGKRLWPLSNDIRSKQFVRFFKTKDGYESMAQRVYRQIRSFDNEVNITVATSESQTSSIYNQLGDNVNISIEPCRKDTFPAIILASAYLVDEKGIDSSESVVVCPVDPYVESDYYVALENLQSIVENNQAKLALMGIEPTYPSEKYGYVIPNNNLEISDVKYFKEKPTKNLAKRYIEQGALWNCGVFAFKLSYVLDIAKKSFGFNDYQSILDSYSDLPKISFDYAVVEKEKSIKLLRFKGKWEDIGSWDSLTSVMDERIIGDAKIEDCSEDVYILNELDLPVLALGLNNIIISASPQGVLVTTKEKSPYVKPLVDELNQQARFAEKSWGTFKVIDVEDESLTMKVTIKAGDYMNYHSHKNRDEVWTIISGRGRTIVDGMEQPVNKGDVITMQAGCRHTIIADTELKLIEVQLGKGISVEDKIIHDIED